jgi:hypothetical protein
MPAEATAAAVILGVAVALEPGLAAAIATLTGGGVVPAASIGARGAGTGVIAALALRTGWMEVAGGVASDGNSSGSSVPAGGASAGAADTRGAIPTVRTAISDQAVSRPIGLRLGRQSVSWLRWVMALTSPPL